MRLKSFYAKTMTEAMQMVRDTLGEDAVIVATREEDGGKSVRVTAAMDERFVSAPSRDSKVTTPSMDDLAFELGKLRQFASTDHARDDWLQYDDEQEDDSHLSETIIDALLRHGAPQDILDELVNAATMSGLDEPNIAFLSALDALFDFTPLPTTAYPKAMMFIGAPGAGKTLAVAKMATQGVMNGLNMAVITTDTIRAGGVEQLQAFTKLLKIDLKKITSPTDLTLALSELKNSDQILIDTPGLNPFKPTDMRALASLAASGEIEPILTLAAAGDADESGEMARIFSALGVRRFVATRLDIARRLGGLLNAARAGGLAFANFSNDASVTSPLEQISPRRLTGFFFPKNDVASTPLRNSPNPTSRNKSTG